ncbi:unnamed protein product, partial [Laminaria digitata]
GKEGWEDKRGGTGVYSLSGMPVGSLKTIETLPSLQCRDGARRVFTDQADTACTKRRDSRGGGVKSVGYCSLGRAKEIAISTFYSREEDFWGRRKYIVFCTSTWQER